MTAAPGASYPSPGPPNLPNPGPPDVPSAPGLLQWFDASVKKRAIVGSGGGSSAAGRLGTAREMLASAGALLERGKQPEACAQLQDLAARADGMASPADLVEGPEAKALIARILALRGEIGCQ